MQTWKNRDIPDHWKPSPDAFSRFMPSWKYILMTDEDNRKFIERHMPDFLYYYDRFPYPIQRADAIRYVWMYVEGGIYCDLDIELLHPLDDLFADGSSLYFVASGNIGSYITNSFMASKPGHPLWLDVIEEMKKPLPWWCLTKHFHVMMSTGPMMLDRVVKRGHYSYMMLPSKLMMPCSVCDDICIVPDAYVRPLMGRSWCSLDSKIFNFFLCEWRHILSVILILVIIVILFFIWRRLTR